MIDSRPPWMSIADARRYDARDVRRDPVRLRLRVAERLPGVDPAPRARGAARARPRARARTVRGAARSAWTARTGRGSPQDSLDDQEQPAQGRGPGRRAESAGVPSVQSDPRAARVLARARSVTT